MQLILFRQKFPASTEEQFKKALQAAEKNCFAVGLTTLMIADWVLNQWKG